MKFCQSVISQERIRTWFAEQQKVLSFVHDNIYQMEISEERLKALLREQKENLIAAMEAIINSRKKFDDRKLSAKEGRFVPGNITQHPL